MSKDEEFWGKKLDESKNPILSCSEYHLVYSGWLIKSAFLSFIYGLKQDKKNGKVDMRLEPRDILFVHAIGDDTGHKHTHVYVMFNTAPERRMSKRFVFEDINGKHNPSVYSLSTEFYRKMVKIYIKLQDAENPPLNDVRKALINERYKLVQKSKFGKDPNVIEYFNPDMQNNDGGESKESKSVDTKSGSEWSRMTPIERSKVRSEIMMSNTFNEGVGIAEKYGMPVSAILIEKLRDEGKELRRMENEQITQSIVNLTPVQKWIFDIVSAYLKNPQLAEFSRKIIWLYSEFGNDGRSDMIRYLRSYFMNYVIVISTNTSYDMFAHLITQINMMIQRRKNSGKGNGEAFVFFIDLPRDFKDTASGSKFYSNLEIMANAIFITNKYFGDIKVLGSKPLIIVTSNKYPAISLDGSGSISNDRWVIFEVLSSLKRFIFWNESTDMNDVRDNVFNIELNNRKRSRGLNPNINRKTLNAIKEKLRELYFSSPAISESKISDIFFDSPSMKTISKRLEIEDGIVQEVRDFFAIGITKEQASTDYKMTERQVEDYLKRVPYLKRRSLYYAMFRRGHQDRKMREKARATSKTGDSNSVSQTPMVEAQSVKSVMDEYYGKLEKASGDMIDDLKDEAILKIVDGVRNSYNNDEAYTWIICKFMMENANEDSHKNLHIKYVQEQLRLACRDRFAPSRDDEFKDDAFHKRIDKPTFTETQINSNKEIENSIINIATSIDNGSINFEISVAANDAVAKYEKDRQGKELTYPTRKDMDEDKLTRKTVSRDENNAYINNVSNEFDRIIRKKEGELKNVGKTQKPHEERDFSEIFTDVTGIKITDVSNSDDVNANSGSTSSTDSGSTRSIISFTQLLTEGDQSLQPVVNNSTASFIPKFPKLPAYSGLPDAKINLPSTTIPSATVPALSSGEISKRLLAKKRETAGEKKIREKQEDYMKAIFNDSRRTIQEHDDEVKNEIERKDALIQELKKNLKNGNLTEEKKKSESNQLKIPTISLDAHSQVASKPGTSVKTSGMNRIRDIKRVGGTLEDALEVAESKDEADFAKSIFDDN